VEAQWSARDYFLPIDSQATNFAIDYAFTLTNEIGTFS
jgi:hypothetical protein